MFLTCVRRALLLGLLCVPLYLLGAEPGSNGPQGPNGEHFDESSRQKIALPSWANYTSPFVSIPENINNAETIAWALDTGKNNVREVFSLLSQWDELEFSQINAAKDQNGMRLSNYLFYKRGGDRTGLFDPRNPTELIREGKFRDGDKDGKIRQELIREVALDYWEQYLQAVKAVQNLDEKAHPHAKSDPLGYLSTDAIIMLDDIQAYFRRQGMKVPGMEDGDHGLLVKHLRGLAKKEGVNPPYIGRDGNNMVLATGSSDPKRLANWILTLPKKPSLLPMVKTLNSFLPQLTARARLGNVTPDHRGNVPAVVRLVNNAFYVQPPSGETHRVGIGNEFLTKHEDRKLASVEKLEVGPQVKPVVAHGTEEEEQRRPIEESQVVPHWGNRSEKNPSPFIAVPEGKQSLEALSYILLHNMDQQLNALKVISRKTEELTWGDLMGGQTLGDRKVDFNFLYYVMDRTENAAVRELLRKVLKGEIKPETPLFPKDQSQVQDSAGFLVLNEIQNLFVNEMKDSYDRAVAAYAGDAAKDFPLQVSLYMDMILNRDNNSQFLSQTLERLGKSDVKVTNAVMDLVFGIQRQRRELEREKRNREGANFSPIETLPAELVDEAKRHFNLSSLEEPGLATEKLRSWLRKALEEKETDPALKHSLQILSDIMEGKDRPGILQGHRGPLTPPKGLRLVATQKPVEEVEEAPIGSLLASAVPDMKRLPKGERMGFSRLVYSRMEPTEQAKYRAMALDNLLFNRDVVFGEMARMEAIFKLKDPDAILAELARIYDPYLDVHSALGTVAQTISPILRRHFGGDKMDPESPEFKMAAAEFIKNLILESLTSEFRSSFAELRLFGPELNGVPADALLLESLIGQSYAKDSPLDISKLGNFNRGLATLLGQDQGALQLEVAAEVAKDEKLLAEIAKGSSSKEEEVSTRAWQVARTQTQIYTGPAEISTNDLARLNHGYTNSTRLVQNLLASEEGRKILLKVLERNKSKHDAGDYAKLLGGILPDHGKKIADVGPHSVSQSPSRFMLRPVTPPTEAKVAVDENGLEKQEDATPVLREKLPAPTARFAERSCPVVVSETSGKVTSDAIEDFIKSDEAKALKAKSKGAYLDALKNVTYGLLFEINSKKWEMREDRLNKERVEEESEVLSAFLTEFQKETAGGGLENLSADVLALADRAEPTPKHYFINHALDIVARIGNANKDFLPAWELHRRLSALRDDSTLLTGQYIGELNLFINAMEGFCQEETNCTEPGAKDAIGLLGAINLEAWRGLIPNPELDKLQRTYTAIETVRRYTQRSRSRNQAEVDMIHGQNHESYLACMVEAKKDLRSRAAKSGLTRDDAGKTVFMGFLEVPENFPKNLPVVAKLMTQNKNLFYDAQKYLDRSDSNLEDLLRYFGEKYPDLSTVKSLPLATVKGWVLEQLKKDYLQSFDRLEKAASGVRGLIPVDAAILADGLRATDEIDPKAPKGNSYTHTMAAFQRFVDTGRLKLEDIKELGLALKAEGGEKSQHLGEWVRSHLNEDDRATAETRALLYTAFQETPAFVYDRFLAGEKASKPILASFAVESVQKEEAERVQRELNLKKSPWEEGDPFLSLSEGDSLEAIIAKLNRNKDLVYEAIDFISKEGVSCEEVRKKLQPFIDANKNDYSNNLYGQMRSGALAQMPCLGDRKKVDGPISQREIDGLRVFLNLRMAKIWDFIPRSHAANRSDILKKVDIDTVPLLVAYPLDKKDTQEIRSRIVADLGGLCEGTVAGENQDLCNFLKTGDGNYLEGVRKHALDQLQTAYERSPYAAKTKALSLLVNLLDDHNREKGLHEGHRSQVALERGVGEILLRRTKPEHYLVLDQLSETYASKKPSEVLPHETRLWMYSLSEEDLYKLRAIAKRMPRFDLEGYRSFLNEPSLAKLEDLFHLYGVYSQFAGSGPEIEDKNRKLAMKMAKLLKENRLSYKDLTELLGGFYQTHYGISIQDWMEVQGMRDDAAAHPQLINDIRIVFLSEALGIRAALFTQPYTKEQAKGQLALSDLHLANLRRHASSMKRIIPLLHSITQGKLDVVHPEAAAVEGVFYDGNSKPADRADIDRISYLMILSREFAPKKGEAVDYDSLKKRARELLKQEGVLECSDEECKTLILSEKGKDASLVEGVKSSAEYQVVNDLVSDLITLWSMTGTRGNLNQATISQLIDERMAAEEKSHGAKEEKDDWYSLAVGKVKDLMGRGKPDVNRGEVLKKAVEMWRLGNMFGDLEDPENQSFLSKEEVDLALELLAGIKTHIEDTQEDAVLFKGQTAPEHNDVLAAIRKIDGTEPSLHDDPFVDEAKDEKPIRIEAKITGRGTPQDRDQGKQFDHLYGLVDYMRGCAEVPADELENYYRRKMELEFDEFPEYTRHKKTFVDVQWDLNSIPVETDYQAIDYSEDRLEHQGYQTVSPYIVDFDPEDPEQIKHAEESEYYRLRGHNTWGYEWDPKKGFFTGSFRKKEYKKGDSILLGHILRSNDPWKTAKAGSEFHLNLFNWAKGKIGVDEEEDAWAVSQKPDIEYRTMPWHVKIDGRSMKVKLYVTRPKGASETGFMGGSFKIPEGPRKGQIVRYQVKMKEMGEYNDEYAQNEYVREQQTAFRSWLKFHLAKLKEGKDSEFLALGPLDMTEKEKRIRQLNCLARVMQKLDEEVQPAKSLAVTPRSSELYSAHPQTYLDALIAPELEDPADPVGAFVRSLDSNDPKRKHDDVFGWMKIKDPANPGSEILYKDYVEREQRKNLRAPRLGETVSYGYGVHHMVDVTDGLESQASYDSDQLGARNLHGMKVEGTLDRYLRAFPDRAGLYDPKEEPWSLTGWRSHRGLETYLRDRFLPDVLDGGAVLDTLAIQRLRNLPPMVADLFWQYLKHIESKKYGTYTDDEGRPLVRPEYKDKTQAELDELVKKGIYPYRTHTQSEMKALYQEAAALIFNPNSPDILQAIWKRKGTRDDIVTFLQHQMFHINGFKDLEEYKKPVTLEDGTLFDPGKIIDFYQNFGKRTAEENSKLREEIRPMLVAGTLYDFRGNRDRLAVLLAMNDDAGRLTLLGPGEKAEFEKKFGPNFRAVYESSLDGDQRYHVGPAMELLKQEQAARLKAGCDETIAGEKAPACAVLELVETTLAKQGRGLPSKARIALLDPKIGPTHLAMLKRLIEQLPAISAEGSHDSQGSPAARGALEEILASGKDRVQAIEQASYQHDPDFYQYVNNHQQIEVSTEELVKGLVALAEKGDVVAETFSEEEGKLKLDRKVIQCGEDYKGDVVELDFEGGADSAEKKELFKKFTEIARMKALKRALDDLVDESTNEYPAPEVVNQAVKGYIDEELAKAHAEIRMLAASRLIEKQSKALKDQRVSEAPLIVKEIRDAIASYEARGIPVPEGLRRDLAMYEKFNVDENYVRTGGLLRDLALTDAKSELGCQLRGLLNSVYLKEGYDKIHAQHKEKVESGQIPAAGDKEAAIDNAVAEYLATEAGRKQLHSLARTEFQRHVATQLPEEVKVGDVATTGLGGDYVRDGMKMCLDHFMNAKKSLREEVERLRKQLAADPTDVIVETDLAVAEAKLAKADEGGAFELPSYHFTPSDRLRGLVSLEIDNSRKIKLAKELMGERISELRDLTFEENGFKGTLPAEIEWLKSNIDDPKYGLENQIKEFKLKNPGRTSIIKLQLDRMERNLGIFRKAKKETEAQLFALRMELEAYTGLSSHSQAERPSKELDPVEERASRWITERVEKEVARLNPTDKPLDGHYERTPSEEFYENLRRDPELLAIIRPFLQEKRQSFETNPKKAALVPDLFGWDTKVDPRKRTDFLQDEDAETRALREKYLGIKSPIRKKDGFIPFMDKLEGVMADGLVDRVRLARFETRQEGIGEAISQGVPAAQATHYSDYEEKFDSLAAKCMEYLAEKKDPLLPPFDIDDSGYIKIKSEHLKGMSEALKKYAFANDQIRAFARGMILPAGVNGKMKGLEELLSTHREMFDHLKKELEGLKSESEIMEALKQVHSEELAARNTEDRKIRELLTRLSQAGFKWNGKHLEMENLELWKIAEGKIEGLKSIGPDTADGKCPTLPKGTLPTNLKCLLQEFAAYGDYRTAGTEPWSMLLEQIGDQYTLHRFQEQFEIEAMGNLLVKLKVDHDKQETTSEFLQRMLENPDQAHKLLEFPNPEKARALAQADASRLSQLMKDYEAQRRNTINISSRFLWDWVYKAAHATANVFSKEDGEKLKSFTQDMESAYTDLYGTGGDIREALALMRRHGMVKAFYPPRLESEEIDAELVKLREQLENQDYKSPEHQATQAKIEEKEKAFKEAQEREKIAGTKRKNGEEPVEMSGMETVLRLENHIKHVVDPDILGSVPHLMKENVDAVNDFWVEFWVTELVTLPLDFLTEGATRHAKNLRWFNLIAKAKRMVSTISGLNKAGQAIGRVKKLQGLVRWLAAIQHGGQSARLINRISLGGAELQKIIGSWDPNDGAEGGQEAKMVLLGNRDSRMVFILLPVGGQLLSYGSKIPLLGRLMTQEVQGILGLGLTSFAVGVYNGEDPEHAAEHAAQSAVVFGLPWGKYMGGGLSKVWGVRGMPRLQGALAGVGTYIIFSQYGVLLSYLQYEKEGKYYDSKGEEVEDVSFGRIAWDAMLGNILMDGYFALKAMGEVQPEVAKSLLIHRNKSLPEITEIYNGREPSPARMARTQEIIEAGMSHITVQQYRKRQSRLTELERITNPTEDVKKEIAQHKQLIDAIVRYQGFHSGDPVADRANFERQIETHSGGKKWHSSIAEVAAEAREVARAELMEKYRNDGSFNLRQLLQHPLIYNQPIEAEVNGKKVVIRRGGVHPEALELLPFRDMLQVLDQTPRDFATEISTAQTLLKGLKEGTPEYQALAEKITKLQADFVEAKAKNSRYDKQIEMRRLVLSVLKGAAEMGGVGLPPGERFPDDSLVKKLTRVIQKKRGVPVQTPTEVGVEKDIEHQEQLDKFVSFVREFSHIPNMDLGTVLNMYQDRSPQNIQALIADGTLSPQQLKEYFGEDLLKQSYNSMTLGQAQDLLMAAKGMASDERLSHLVMPFLKGVDFNNPAEVRNAQRQAIIKLREDAAAHLKVLAERSGLSPEVYVQLLEGSQPPGVEKVHAEIQKLEEDQLLPELIRSEVLKVKGALRAYDEAGTDLSKLQTQIIGYQNQLDALPENSPKRRGLETVLQRLMKQLPEVQESAKNESALRERLAALESSLPSVDEAAAKSQAEYEQKRAQFAKMWRDFNSQRSVDRTTGFQIAAGEILGAAGETSPQAVTLLVESPYFSTPIGARYVPAKGLDPSIAEHQTYIEKMAKQFYNTSVKPKLYTGLEHLDIPSPERDAFLRDFNQWFSRNRNRVPASAEGQAGSIMDALRQYQGTVRRRIATEGNGALQPVEAGTGP